MAITHLILMRHAKSSWANYDLTDHQRPLNKRGVRAATTMGQVLASKNLGPDIIWSSDSVRTRETVDLAFGKTANILWLESFYHASANHVLLKCAQLGEPETGILALIGHNPGWEDLVYYFSGQSFRMPTAACAVFSRTENKNDWLSKNAWQMQDYLLPRDYE